MVVEVGVEVGVAILSHLQIPIPTTGEGTSCEHSPPLQTESSMQYRPSSHVEESGIVVEVEVGVEVVVAILSHLQIPIPTTGEGTSLEHFPPLQSESSEQY